MRKRRYGEGFGDGYNLGYAAGFSDGMAAKKPVGHRGMAREQWEAAGNSELRSKRKARLSQTINVWVPGNPTPKGIAASSHASPRQMSSRSRPSSPHTDLSPVASPRVLASTFSSGHKDIPEFREFPPRKPSVDVAPSFSVRDKADELLPSASVNTGAGPPEEVYLRDRIIVHLPRRQPHTGSASTLPRPRTSQALKPLRHHAASIPRNRTEARMPIVDFGVNEAMGETLFNVHDVVIGSSFGGGKTMPSANQTEDAAAIPSQETRFSSHNQGFMPYAGHNVSSFFAQPEPEEELLGSVEAGDSLFTQAGESESLELRDTEAEIVEDMERKAVERLKPLQRLPGHQPLPKSPVRKSRGTSRPKTQGLVSWQLSQRPGPSAPNLPNLELLMATSSGAPTVNKGKGAYDIPPNFATDGFRTRTRGKR